MPNLPDQPGTAGSSSITPARNDQNSSNAPRPPIRLGVIGTGLAAKRLHWPAIAKQPDHYSIVGFADQNRANAEAFADLAHLSMDGYAADYRAILDRTDVEAVLVAVPIPSLFAVARDALEAGKHVICEKPPGVSEEEGRVFAALVQRFSNRKVLMGEQFFYRDEARVARSLIDAGAIAERRLLLQRTMKHEVPAPGNFASTPWRSTPAYPGGSLLDGGVHPVAEIRVLGGDVTTLFARTEWANSTINAESVMAMTFGFAGGFTGNYVYGSFDHPLADDFHDTRVYGTAGELIVGLHHLTHVHADGAVDEYTFADSSAHYNEFLNFYEALAYGAPIVGTVAQSLKNMLFVLRGLQSAASGQAVEVGKDDWNQPLDGVPLWRPHGALGLLDGLPTKMTVTRGAEARSAFR